MNNKTGSSSSPSNSGIMKMPLTSEEKAEEIPAGILSAQMMEIPSTSEEKAEEISAGILSAEMMEMPSTSEEKAEEIPAGVLSAEVMEMPSKSEEKAEEIPAGILSAKMMEIPSTSEEKAEEIPAGVLSAEMMEMPSKSEEKAEEIPAGVLSAEMMKIPSTSEEKAEEIPAGVLSAEMMEIPSKSEEKAEEIPAGILSAEMMEIPSKSEEKAEEIPAGILSAEMMEMPSTSEEKAEEIPAGVLSAEMMEMPSKSEEKAEKIPVSDEMMEMPSTSGEKTEKIPGTASNAKPSILQDQNSLQTEQNKQASESVNQAGSVSTQNLPHIGSQNNTSSYQHGTWRGMLELLSGIVDKYQITCDVLTISKAGTPCLEMNNWQNLVSFNSLPVRWIKGAFNNYSEGFKIIYLYPQHHNFLENQTNIMKHGVMGSITTDQPSSCMEIFLLFSTGKDCAYLGFIPNNRAAFARAFEKMIKKENFARLLQEQVYEQPESLFEMSSHVVGDVIAKSALKVFKRCSEPFNDVNAEESRKYRDTLVASASEFFNTLIPRHLHDAVTKHSLACIASLNEAFYFLRNDYNILDIFVRSHATNIDFSSKIHSNYL